MYCEKCKRVIGTDRCPFCKKGKVRELQPDDICFLTEQDYVSSGMLEDVLRQNDIRFLKKDVMGAGMAIKVGPMLERSRFYVPAEQWEDAVSITDQLFAPSPDVSVDEQWAPDLQNEG